MTFVKSAAAAAALCLTLGATGVYAAQASEPETFVGCLHMQKKASAALEANQQSPNYFAAQQEANGARSFCDHNLYKTGISKYGKVLELLGAS